MRSSGRVQRSHGPLQQQAEYIMAKRISVIVARDLKNGIGNKGDLPWPRLSTDREFLHRKSSTTNDKSKQNAIIMGRLTWESIPEKKRPHKDRFDIVLTSRKPEGIPGAHLVCSSLEAAMESLQSPPLNDKIESVYIFGGMQVYKEAMKSPLCDTLYVTDVLAEFEADTFFPPIDTSIYQLVNDPDDPLVPRGEHKENGVQFRFTVYKRVSPQV